MLGDAGGVGGGPAAAAYGHPDVFERAEAVVGGERPGEGIQDGALVWLGRDCWPGCAGSLGGAGCCARGGGGHGDRTACCRGGECGELTVGCLLGSQDDLSVVHLACSASTHGRMPAAARAAAEHRRAHVSQGQGDGPLWQLWQLCARWVLETTMPGFSPEAEGARIRNKTL